MGNAAIAISIAMQALQLAQQIQAMLQAAAAENRDLTDDELNSLSTQYQDTHAKVDVFLNSKGK